MVDYWHNCKGCDKLLETVKKGRKGIDSGFPPIIEEIEKGENKQTFLEIKHRDVFVPTRGGIELSLRATPLDVKYKDPYHLVCGKCDRVVGSFDKKHAEWILTMFFMSMTPLSKHVTSGDYGAVSDCCKGTWKIHIRMIDMYKYLKRTKELEGLRFIIDEYMKE